MKIQRNQGFTLIEILVVLVILATLVAAVAPNILGKSDDARVTVAKADLKAISNALDLYKLDNFNYPTTEQGLEALVNKPTGFPEPKNWAKGGYLPKIPKDPWGTPYQYLSPAEDKPFDVYTLGADSREGGEDYNSDLSVWDE
ncbi:type II secretion system major pseudopilin GspG [Litoribacillus peritrichatus]|uniref:Type II secretion system core protein G n=1 Tax=Litoribacillus peritrichatus TaxID=718191 RepID=A0ABP7MCZ9_9GAMM